MLSATVALLLVVAGAGAAGEGSALAATPTAPATKPTQTESAAIERALSEARVGRWVDRYPVTGLIENAELDQATGTWTVRIWSGEEQIALVRLTGEGDVREAWTGPQVGWTMARGLNGAFGRTLNDPAVWLGFVALFLLGLLDLRRPLSMHNVDLLVLVSLTASLWFFNRGDIFTSVPLVYPPLGYFLGRMLWIGLRGRAPRPPRLLWPTWILIVAAVFALGFRVGLNVQTSNVIDVGYAGVIGAQRIVSEGRSPYGAFPVRDGAECGPPDADGLVRDRVQENGRCEASNEHGDTYGPVNYVAYVPAYLIFGWSGLWDDLPAAHATALIFDLAVIFGLALVGWRFGRARLAAILVFAWVAFPFTQYVSSTNANDALVPALLVLGFWAAASAPARGALVGLASWAKFAPLVVAPLWATFPMGLRRPGKVTLFAGGFAVATVFAFWVLLLESDPLGAAHTFWDRTFGWQLGRNSPFSIWDWGRYGYPDLGWLQTALKVGLAGGALALAAYPRTKSMLQLAALTAALLIAFEVTLTHWFYLYVSWFLPFVVLAMFWPSRGGHRRSGSPAGPGAPPPDREAVEAASAAD
ncbi:MAG: hypothetical protein ACE5EV_02140 [Gaiellales bacterium]